MELHLLDNGLNSLSMGVTFYEMYLYFDDKYPFDRDSYLKLALICVHNSIEIFSKKILSEIDELLIYKDLSNPELLKILGALNVRKNKQSGKRRNIPLHYSLIVGDTDVYTIEYRECIERLKHIFNIDDEFYRVLKEIGVLRNKVTHFGIDRAVGLHTVLGPLNRSLDFVIEFFYPRFKKRTKNQIGYLYDRILDVIEIGQQAELEAWGVIYEPNFELLDDLLKKICEDADFNQYLSEKKLKLVVETGRYIEEGEFGIDLINTDTDEYEAKAFTINFPRLDATLLIGDYDYGPVFAVIEHDVEPVFYVYKTPLKLAELQNTYQKFWKNDKKCYRTALNMDRLIEVIKNLEKIDCHELK